MSSFLSQEGKKKSSIQYIAWLPGPIINKSSIACRYSKKTLINLQQAEITSCENKFRSDDILQRGNTIPIVMKEGAMVTYNSVLDVTVGFHEIRLQFYFDLNRSYSLVNLKELSKGAN